MSKDRFFEEWLAERQNLYFLMLAKGKEPSRALLRPRNGAEEAIMYRIYRNENKMMRRTAKRDD